MKTFIVYTRDDCGWCVLAKTLLNKQGIVFTELNVGKDVSRDVFLEFVDDHSMKPTVPKIVVDDQLIGGYEDLVEYFENEAGGYGEGGL